MMKKYKWLYLWIAAVALLVFGLTVILNSEFGKSVIFYVTGGMLIGFVIIRFVPLIKTSRNNWAIAINAIEMFVDLVIGVLMIFLTAKVEDKEFLYKFYPFLVGGVIYIRGSVYFVEVAFFNTKVETSKFFVSLALITAGAVIMGRYDNFNVNSIRWILGIAFTICGIVAVGDGYINYNNYRKIYVLPKKEIEKAKKAEQNIEVPAIDNEIIIDENGSKPQEYVN